MSWAQPAIDRLCKGETVVVRPRGNSMTGKVEDGAVVTLEPCAPDSLKVGDVVLARVGGRDYLHLVKAVAGRRFLIGNNRGGTNGWTSQVFGIATKIE